MDLQLPIEQTIGDLGMNVRSDAMPVYVPASGVLGRECEAFVVAEPSPDALCMWPQFVHDDRGVGVALVQDRAVLTDECHQAIKTQRREIDIRRREIWVLGCAEMRMGKPPVPGDRMHCASPSN